MTPFSKTRTADWAAAAAGVELAEGGPRVVRYYRRWGRLRLAQDERRDPAEAVAGGMRETECALRRIHVPLSSRRKAVRVWRSLLDIELPGGMGGKAAIPLAIEPSKNGWDVLVAVADREAVSTCLEAYRQQGFDLHVLDHESAALWTQALMEFPPEKPDEPRVVLYATDDRLTVAVGVGAALRASAGARAFEGKAIRRLLRSVGIGGNAEIRWIWGGSRVEPEGEWLALIARLAGGIGRHDRFFDPAAVLARAYACRALQNGALRCNFRVDEWVHPESVRQRVRRHVRIGLLTLGVGLVALAGFMADVRWIEACDREVQRAIQAAVHTIGDHLGLPIETAPGYERAQVEAVIQEAEPRYRPFVRMTGPSLVSALGRLLASARRDAMEVHRLEGEDDRLRVSGWAASRETVERWMNEVSHGDGGRVIRKEITPNGSGWTFEVETVVR